MLFVISFLDPSISRNPLLFAFSCVSLLISTAKTLRKLYDKSGHTVHSKYQTLHDNSHEIPIIGGNGLFSDDK
jgi:hypothetical protein